MQSYDEIQNIFAQYDGVMKTCQLEKYGITYRKLQKLIENGYVEKIRSGYYQWQDDKAFSDINAIISLFPDAIICDNSALMYYSYTDRTSEKWHLAVDSKESRTKYVLDYVDIKPHYIDSKRLNIGVSSGKIDGVTVKIYDRERIICDCLRHVNTMDGEIYRSAIKRYISDQNHDIPRLIEYAGKLGVEKKVREVICVWL